MSLTYRQVRSYIISAIPIALVILLNGCINVIVVENGVASDGRVLTLEFEGVKFAPHDFETSGIDSIGSARSYWLKQGNRVVFEWDTFEMHWQSDGAVCPFENNQSTEGCLVCDLCRPDTLVNDCGSIVPAPRLVTLLSEPTFLETDSPNVILDFDGPNTSQNLRFTCGEIAPGRPNDFEPTADGLYTMRVGHNIRSTIKGETDGEVLIHVIAPDAPQRAAFQLTPDTIDGNTVWRWDAGGSPVWEENFSPDVRVSEIRFYRGRCIDDRSTGRTCVLPEGAEPVKPSRVLFIPVFPGTLIPVSEADKRCYARPEPVEGAFFLFNECRTTYSTDPNLQTVEYVINPSYRLPQETDLITWLVDFNLIEGADQVQMQEPLIIEFTLAAD
ncbi:MAG: hypothetical protein DWQ47_11090 [Acidobacteria bacterium]|nr:MAG: hypothetical protein DWQ32_13505 [Acidobacteriota bacterium]REJ98124.1 MAG: hypothetical protein DWQ38_16305 [Acidobacteriota bacterium]REK16867.1 MAG: hypothetical protein DWQ43_01350 [Acidobacteriota bacterium]REK42778.1 MAG: hypothetical protein DWQ47_11090 [Acidobacteriota bacterium]